jgi:hypothetical protein
VRRLGRHSGFKGVMEGCCVRSYGGMLTWDKMRRPCAGEGMLSWMRFRVLDKPLEKGGPRFTRLCCLLESDEFTYSLLCLPTGIFWLDSLTMGWVSLLQNSWD